MPSLTLRRALTAALAAALLAPSLASAQSWTSTPPCTPPPPPPVLDPHRSLWVHDVATLTSPLANFSLRRTLDQLAAQAVAAGAGGTTALSIFRELWDTQNTGPSLGLGAHCDDNVTGGIPGFTLNDYPYRCRPSEGQQATGGSGLTPNQYLDRYIAIGFVNRFDLQDAGYQSCGEFRIVYAKRPGAGPGRNFMIFEATMPNPQPGCPDACRPVVDFWTNLSTEPDPNVRAQHIQQFYYNGVAGFPPVVHIDHYSFGTSTTYGATDGGQIRTNQFMTGPWLLREFKLAIVDPGTGPQMEVVPVTVKVNPYGQLFDSSLPGASPYMPRATNFQTQFVSQLGDLALPDINAYFYAPDDTYNWGESPANFEPAQDYRGQINIPGTPTPFMNAVDSFDPTLDRQHMANRALTLSCAGCHQPSAYGLLAPGSIADPLSPIAAPVSPFAPAGTTDRWPDSLGFVHADENPVGFPPVFPLSPALIDVFLPARESKLAAERAADICTCTYVPPPPVTASSSVARSADDGPVRRRGARPAELGGTPRVIESDAARLADGDDDFEALLITAEIQAMDAAEPPRLTTDGTIRTH